MKNAVLEKSENFAFRMIELYKFLSEKKEFILSRQILRCGTSVGANISEAELSISKKEFIAKMQISLKECAETSYWLKLLNKGQYINAKEFESLNRDCMEIRNILTAIVKTSKRSVTKKSYRS